MATVKRVDSTRAALAHPPHQEINGDEAFGLNDFEEELKRLAAANQELLNEFRHDDDATVEMPLAVHDELEQLRRENAELKARFEELTPAPPEQTDDTWLERQREYEMLLEEKSEVIRNLHLKLQEMQESAIGGPSAPVNNVGASSTRLGQAEEIFRLKREMDEQRRQLEQDEADMVAQLRQMEVAMAKERAEMARQRQEVQRLQADLARDIEQSGRDPELRERLHNLRRSQEPKAADTPTPTKEQKSSGFFRRIFG